MERDPIPLDTRANSKQCRCFCAPRYSKVSLCLPTPEPFASDLVRIKMHVNNASVGCKRGWQFFSERKERVEKITQIKMIFNKEN